MSSNNNLSDVGSGAVDTIWYLAKMWNALNRYSNTCDCFHGFQRVRSVCRLSNNGKSSAQCTAGSACRRLHATCHGAASVSRIQA